MDDELYGQIEDALEEKLGRKPSDNEIKEEFANMCDALAESQDYETDYYGSGYCTDLSQNGDY